MDGRVTVARDRASVADRRALFSGCSEPVHEWLPARVANSPRRNLPEGHNDSVENVRTVLVVDDEETVRDVVGQYLARDGFRVVATGDGREVTGLVEREAPQLVVLDVMLPGIGGLELCREIRTRWAIPVILLTARSDESDRIVGLELGADDYVTKPFSPRELVARVRAVLRRGGGGVSPEVLQLGELEIDVPAREVRLRGNDVRLAAREFELLAFLARHPRRVFTRE